MIRVVIILVDTIAIHPRRNAMERGTKEQNKCEDRWSKSDNGYGSGGGGGNGVHR
jgi:hypothetical protein